MNPDAQSTDSTTSDPPGPIDRVFGAENRARLLTRYFAAREAVTPANAWRHVYHLLLWIDRTTALAHCHVVHINPQAVLAAYGDSGRRRRSEAIWIPVASWTSPPGSRASPPAEHRRNAKLAGPHGPRAVRHIDGNLKPMQPVGWVERSETHPAI